MTTHDDLINAALIGTSRSKATFLDAGDERLASALASLATASAEEQLLGAAAVLSAYDTCGRTLSPRPPLVATPAPADTCPPCSRRAADVLLRLLGLSNNSTKQFLIAEWLHAASAAGRSVAHALLPKLLDYGSANRVTRDAIAAAVDQRGHWLMAQNPRWRYAAPAADPAKVWDSGTPEQRASALRALRTTDPAAAVDLVRSTWKEDSAEERANFVSAMLTNLSAADEPFLEAALDDRSKQVRAAAVDLLARLPSSALVRRMTQRADALLAIRQKSPGGLLRKSQPAAIEVTLPPDAFDPAWERDGVAEKPPTPKAGKRQWWLGRILAAVPPSHWSAAWGLSPGECIAAARGDYEGLLLAAWSDAAVRFGDASWIAALVADSLRDERPGPRADLLRHLPAGRRHELLGPLLASTRLTQDSLRQILDAIDAPLDDALAAAAAQRVEQFVTAKGASFDYHLPAVLEPLARLVPVDVGRELSGRWTGPAWDANRRTLDAFFQTLELRRAIRTEFA